MRRLPLPDPEFGDRAAADTIETIIVPRLRDIGPFMVKRSLPAAQRQMVGPFIFLDHFGPAEMISSEKFDVRPHPHIGLATVTYLYDGAIVHRDPIGSEQPISPGDVKRLAVGSLYGARAPVTTFSEMFFADVTLVAGAALPLDAT